MKSRVRFTETLITSDRHSVEDLNIAHLCVEVNSATEEDPTGLGVQDSQRHHSKVGSVKDGRADVT